MTPEVRDRIEQLRHGIVPEGYKKVGSDIIPSDWSKSPFSQLGVISSGLVNPKEQPYFEMQHIGPDNIEKDTGRILETQSAAELGLISGKFYFDSNSIVYSKIRPNLNKVCAPHFEGICSADCYSIKPTNKIDKAYLLNLMLGYSFYKRAVECSMRTGMPKINQDDLNTIAMCYPKSIDEQKKIAKILTTQDKVIESKEKLLAEKQRQKKYLMQRLLTGKKRLPGFDAEWEKTPLKKLLKERKTYSPKGAEYPHVTLSTEGIYAKSDRYDRDHLVKDEEKEYKITHKGDICYNPANLKFGVICINNFGDAIFSPIYVTFEVVGNVSSAFLSNYLMRWDFINAVRKYEEGTVYERMAVKPEDFLKFEMMLPPYEEQVAIAEILAVADEEIDLLRCNLEQEKQKKKALMQLLLTGIVRV
ncbi:MAG: restriction endonuclease subunit S [Oscillospiraceae bacterium]|nr:restriction endonuclease subunit S [Oscillospiraceae bacterium]